MKQKNILKSIITSIKHRKNQNRETYVTVGSAQKGPHSSNRVIAISEQKGHSFLNNNLNVGSGQYPVKKRGLDIKITYNMM